MDLSSLTYADLQKLAKDAGLKANMKTEKLLNALKLYYQRQEENPEQANKVTTGSVQLDDAGGIPPSIDNCAFVTKHRGRGTKTKSKRANAVEVAAESNRNSAGNIDQMDENLEKPSSNKRRKVSEEVRSLMPTSCMASSEKKVMQPQLGSAEETGVDAGKGEDKRAVRAGRIPRLEGLLKRESRPVLKPTTPNFKKLHEAHFNKMESIDSYVQRKAKQMEVYRNSVKELKLLSEKAIPKPTDRRILKPAASSVSMFSPAPSGQKATSGIRRLTQPSSSKSVPKDNNVFTPTVLSTRKINVRFSEAALDNEHKHSLVKTPARRSHLENNWTPQPISQKKLELKPAFPASNIKTPGTAFVFTGNTSTSTTPGTNKKNTFDLKASLSRPLTYQPHKGKLKPFEMTQEKTALNRSQFTESHQKKYKQHQIQTRENRRAEQTVERKQKKEKVLGARRGLVIT